MFSDIFMLFVLLVTMLLISGMLWAVIMTYKFGDDDNWTRDLKIKLFENPLKNDGVLLAILETTESGVPMKKLFTLVAIQQPDPCTVKEGCIVSYEGNTYDVAALTNTLLNDVYFKLRKNQNNQPKNYLLRITDPEMILGGIYNEDGIIVPNTDQKSTTRLWLVDGTTVNLELYVD